MGIAAIIEILVIFGVIAIQYSVFRNSQKKVKVLSNSYPDPDKLSIQQYVLSSDALESSEAVDNQEEDEEEANQRIVQATLGGETFRNVNFPDTIHKVIGISSGHLTIEVVRTDSEESSLTTFKLSLASLKKKVANGEIGLINDLEVLRNNSSSSNQDNEEESILVDLIEVDDPTSEFSEIILDTNEYLENNRGAAADFNILKDISERYSEAIDNEVQAGIATPLYIGLLGTFFGVSVGLASLLFGGSSEISSSFISDAGIKSFLIGVVIAMAGSFFGLLFTLRGNYLLKNARSNRDKLKNRYYTFLQKSLLPKLNSDMAASLGNLKSVLDSFNHDFLEKVANFQPIIASLTDNIKIQKDFIVKLDEIGFTKMANANIKVFDKIKESEQLFENFLGYQNSLNRTVKSGADMADKIHGALARMTKLEEGFALVPGYLEKHDESIMRQVHFFERHQRDLDAIANKVEQNFDEDADRLKVLMDKRLDVLERDAQNAYESWQEHFNKLNQDNVYTKIQEFMQPFSKLNEQQEALNNQQSAFAKTIQVTNDRLLQRLDKDAYLQQKLVEQFEVSNQILAEATRRSRVQEMIDKVFGTSVKSNKRGKV